MEYDFEWHHLIGAVVFILIVRAWLKSDSSGGGGSCGGGCGGGGCGGCGGD